MAEHAIELPTAWGKLSATLLVPERPGPLPAVLLVGGSGPTDRDGNNPLLPAPINNMRQLAQALAARGMVSLRYDKRGTGASSFPGMNEEALRFEHLVDDAVQLALLLREQPRIADVVLVGHSEGALVAALAARDAGVRALISISGAGTSASALMRRQIRGNLPADLAEPALAALDALERGERLDDVPDTLALLFRRSVQPYLISWFRHDPPRVLAAVPVPVLLVQGTADTQVPPDHAQALQRGRPDASLWMVDGMDHLLAWRGDIPAGAGLVAGRIADWLEELEATSPAP